MTTLKVGSLFSGYGGLDLAVHMAIPESKTVWVSDVEPGPNKILAERFPGIPNLGDITTIDWNQVEPVDILVGGSPCQDLSAAGQRAGMRPGTRSGLWESMAQAIETLRPRLVIWENVHGALSAPAFSLMESETGPMGNESGGPVLRALGRVLGDLANLGYDAQWATVRAADVGAPHGRRRVFVIAYPHSSGFRESWGSVHVSAEYATVERDNALLPTPTVGDKGGTEARSGDGFGAPLGEVARLLSTPQARDGKGAPQDGYNLASLPRDVAQRTTDWGVYAPAIHRWENILGRSAPDPTEPNPRTGKPQLSPAFVEWMMGLPAGWVTDVDISRPTQLRALGNGVVPQQGATAITHLLTRK